MTLHLYCEWGYMKFVANMNHREEWVWEMIFAGELQLKQDSHIFACRAKETFVWRLIWYLLSRLMMLPWKQERWLKHLHIFIVIYYNYTSSWCSYIAGIFTILIPNYIHPHVPQQLNYKTLVSSVVRGVYTPYSKSLERAWSRGIVHGQDKGIFFCPVHNASTPCSL